MWLDAHRMLPILVRVGMAQTSQTKSSRSATRHEDEKGKRNNRGPKVGTVQAKLKGSSKHVGSRRDRRSAGTCSMRRGRTTVGYQILWPCGLTSRGPTKVGKQRRGGEGGMPSREMLGVRPPPASTPTGWLGLLRQSEAGREFSIYPPGLFYRRGERVHCMYERQRGSHARMRQRRRNGGEGGDRYGGGRQGGVKTAWSRGRRCRQGLRRRELTGYRVYIQHSVEEREGLG